MTSDSPTSDPQSRVQRLAEVRRMSVQDLVAPQAAAAQPEAVIDEALKWRRLINASGNSQLTALWERYDADCQIRGISDPYLSFVAKAQHLTHKDLPLYWDLYAHSCLEEGKIPDPFLEFATRMQAALEPETGVSKNTKPGGAVR